MPLFSGGTSSGSTGHPRYRPARTRKLLKCLRGKVVARKAAVCLSPNLRRAAFVQQVRDIEIAQQFQVGQCKEGCAMYAGRLGQARNFS